MTREIEFRAWNSLDRKMIYDITQTKQFSNIDGGYDIIGFDSYLDDGSGTVIMQYTGLKDKNGKKIFEGDIVISVHNQYYKHGEIVWDNYDMGWYIGKEDSWKLRSPMSLKTEVIGNIYVNPELLGGKNG